MKLRSIRGRLLLVSLILSGLLISSLGFRWWDSEDYPLPASVRDWLAPPGAPAPPTGIRRKIAQWHYQLWLWRQERIRREMFCNVDLGNPKWRYLISRPGGPGSLRGVLEFRPDGSATFSPPIPPYLLTLPEAVGYSRPRYDVVRLAWNDGQLDLTLSAFGGGKFGLRGEWEGRSLRLWQWSGRASSETR